MEGIGDSASMVEPVWARMRDPGLESAFRDFDFRSARRRILAFVTIAGVAVLTFSIVEVIYRAESQSFARVQATRLIVSGALLCLAAVLTRIKRRVLFERTAFAASLLIALIACTAPLHRPPDYVDNYFFDILLILAYYLLFVIPPRLHVIPPLLMSAVQLVVLFTLKEVANTHQIIVISAAFVVANIAGICSSWHVNRTNRLRYLDYRRQSELRQELQETLDRLELLEGLIPICSHCKRIRDDAGEWERVEAFVRRHANVQFSHSICPDCARKHYQIDLDK